MLQNFGKNGKIGGVTQDALLAWADLWEELHAALVQKAPTAKKARDFLTSESTGFNAETCLMQKHVEQFF